MEIKEFNKYKNSMDYETLLAFAKYGFISLQIHKHLFKELKK